MERVKQRVMDYDLKQRYWKRHGQLLGGSQHRQQFALRHSNGGRAGAHRDSEWRFFLHLLDFTAKRVLHSSWECRHCQRDRRCGLRVDGFDRLQLDHYK